MDLDSPEEVLQIQNIYDIVEDWQLEILTWIWERGWDLGNLKSHKKDNSHYLVTGVSPRNPDIKHVCIYKNGELWHDPHPDNTGILTEDYFQYIEKVSKICFKCNIMKPLTDYYKHPATKDRLLGKCKSCTKKDAKDRTEINISIPEGLEKERERHRDKYHRLGYKDIQKESNKNHPWKNCSIYKGLRRSKKYANLDRSFELHHWNYNNEYLEDIFILNIRSHKNLHNHLTLDVDKRLFYLKNGTYLDTREKHEDYIKKLNIEIYKQ